MNWNTTRFSFFGIPFILIFCFLLSGCSTQESSSVQGDRQTAEDRQPVQAFGVFHPLSSETVSFGFPVKIKRVLVRKGQTVSLGMVLAECDLNYAREAVIDLEDQLKLLRAETGFKQKLLTERENMLAAAKDPDLIKLERGLEKARMEQEASCADLEEKRKLLEAGALSREEYSKLVNRTDELDYACTMAELNLKSMQKSRREEINQLNAGVETGLMRISALERRCRQSEAELNAAGLKDGAIVSTLSEGIVSEIFCKNGSVLPADTAVVTIYDSSGLFVEAMVDEQFIKDVKSGAKAYVVPESDLSQEFEGTVTAISNCAVQQNSETVIPVQITFDQPPRGIHPGYNAEITIEPAK